MTRLTFTILALLLAGCAGMGEWRELTIDGSSESVFEDSLDRLNDELPYKRRQLLSLALADRTGTPIAQLYYLPLQRQALTEDARNFRPRDDGLYCCTPPEISPPFTPGD